MNIRPIALAAALLPALAPQTAAAGGPDPRNGLVGLWSTEIYASPAACTPGAPPPPLTGRNTMVFNAGGTLVENPQVTPPGVPGAPQLRTFGLGKWSYDPRTTRYKVSLRFDWYASSDGLYLGYQVVDRTILLSHDRKRAYGPVTSTRYAPDGSIVAKLCGQGISIRQ